MLVALFFLVGVSDDEDIFSEDIGDGATFSEEDPWGREPSDGATFSEEDVSERKPSVGQTSRERKEPHVTDCCLLLYAAIVIKEPAGSQKCEYFAVFCSISQTIGYSSLQPYPRSRRSRRKRRRRRKQPAKGVSISQYFAVFRSISQKFLAVAHKICCTVLVQRTEPAKRKYKLCPVRGCRSVGPHQKLTQHLKQYHCMDDTQERLSMTKSAKVVAFGYNAALRMDKGQLHSLQ